MRKASMFKKVPVLCVAVFFTVTASVCACPAVNNFVTIKSCNTCHSKAGGTSIQDGVNSETPLYQIYTALFGGTYTSSNELFAYIGLSDYADDRWSTTAQNGLVKVTVRKAGYDQELGIIDLSGVNGYTPIVSGISPGITDPVNVYIDADYDFAFVEKLSGSGSGAWYSDDRSGDSIDHFVAFDVLDEYIDTYGGNVSQAWMIAFEDLPASKSDRDYNDLVAVVAEVEPVCTVAEEIIPEVKALNGNVLIIWTAVSEDNVVGYNILRKDGMFGPYIQINETMIAARGNIAITEEYSYNDNNLQNGKLYQYKILEIEDGGDTVVHGPITAIPRRLYKKK